MVEESVDKNPCAEISTFRQIPWWCEYKQTLADGAVVHGLAIGWLGSDSGDAETLRLYPLVSNVGGVPYTTPTAATYISRNSIIAEGPCLLGQKRSRANSTK